MTSSGSSSNSAGLCSPSKRSLSQASDALEISSRRKISRFEYSEWIIRSSSCLTYCSMRHSTGPGGCHIAVGALMRRAGGSTMIDNTVVELSRWQFAATALYHFLFVPLTLGLTFLLAAMETVYVTTGRDIY